MVSGEVNYKLSKTVMVFNLQTQKLKKSADLNQARRESSATGAGESIYVFGGLLGGGGYLDTIEALNVSSRSSKWEIIHSQNFTARRSAVVSSLSEDRILICGGLGDGGWLKDVLVFDTKPKKARKVADAPMTFYNNGNNQAYYERDGVFLALMMLEDKGK